MSKVVKRALKNKYGSDFDFLFFFIYQKNDSFKKLLQK